MSLFFYYDIIYMGDSMYIVDIINKKRNNEKLSFEEIKYMVNGYTKDEIKDYQMSSLLMAICINGMDSEETYYLTECMLNSGDKINLSSIPGIKVDKHSTGGIGDKTTLIVAPIVASLGVPVPKMSGRGLGYTGGTIDKLESIPGFNVNLSSDDIIKQTTDIGICISSINKNVVPADKKIYALRDVTGTVSSMSLIASSIMSKKLAMGADKILLDVKYGSGALLQTKEEAIDLAKLMIYIGNNHGKETMALITNMNYPLGNMIGNALEVKEALEILSNRGNPELRELCVIISTYMVSMSKNISFADAGKEVLEALKSQKAYNKFLTMINYQKGDISKLTVSDNVVEVRSNKEGFINEINALKIGQISMKLGAGRKNKEDTIDHSVGIEIVKHIGSYVKNRDVIARVYINKVNIDINEVLDAFLIERELKEQDKLIYGVIK